MKKIKDSIKKAVQKEMPEIKIDVDVEYCKANSIKYPVVNCNGVAIETSLDNINTIDNKLAFDFICNKINSSNH